MKYIERPNELSEAILFCTLTIGLSFLVFWGPIALLHIHAASLVSGTRGPIWAIVLFLVGGCVPSVVAVLLTAVREGGERTRLLIGRCLQFGLGLEWYCVIITVLVIGASGQIVIAFLLYKTFSFSAYLTQLPSLLVLLVGGPISEEFGWRGYLLPRLQKKWNALVSAIVVGMVWALWHLPLFYIYGTSQHELHMPFGGFLLGTIALSIIMTWVNNNTRNSLWAAVLMHWLYSYSSQANLIGVRGPMPYDWLQFLPYMLIAIVIVAIWSLGRMTKGARHKWSAG